ncbi:MAG: helix-turn-helix domain-containing protein [Candidatus Coproplasma sp.]
MTTGDKIAQERKKINLTQEQLAYKLGVTRQAVSRWEADLAYPETEKLIRLSALFGCSVDYLLNDGRQNDSDGQGEVGRQNDSDGQDEVGRQNDSDGQDEVGRHGGYAGNRGRKTSFSVASLYGARLADIFYEYKSERTLFGMPLVHVNLGLGRTAKGFIAIGIKAKGVISIGVLSLGVFAFGVLSLGIFAFGVFALALIAAFGSVAAGLVAFGAVAFGFVSFGAVAIGAFADGALAIGGYVGVGDRAYGLVAIGKSYANGEYTFMLKESTDFDLLSAEIDAAINSAVPAEINWLGHMCASFGAFMIGG